MTFPPHVYTGSIDARAGGWPDDPQKWLSCAEQEERVQWRNPARRDEWLAGRWLLKNMIFGDWPAPEFADVEILSRDPLGRRRPPCVLAGGRTLPIHVSLAHAGGVVWAALSTLLDVRVGIDVVPENSFLQHGGPWFADAERHWPGRADDPTLAATLWAAKEAVYKATNRGEPFVPARINVACDGSGQYRWCGDGAHAGADHALRVGRSAASIVALAVVAAKPGIAGVCDD